MVIGTTGWYHQLDEVKAIVQSAKMGVIYASNFSLGMNLFFRIVECAAELFDKFEEYDPFIHETHHRRKVDSPSGTAVTLGKILLEKIKRKSDILAQNSEGAISPKHLHISSTRAGEVPGTHLVGFDSAADTVELKHTARDRSGFALGALYAAEWIVAKHGLFTLNDLFKDIFQ
jgi:4-hydroxy-tetrahydrodipicolinate reductase